MRDWQIAHDRAIREAVRLRRERAKLVERHHLLMHEAHHRVRNHLQLITASATRRLAQTTDPAVRQFGARTLAQVQSLARLYETVGTAHGNVELSSYLAKICEDLKSLSDNPVILLEHRAQKLMVPGEQALSLGLIASELVTNSYKHAFRRRASGNILVELLTTDARTSALCVSDTGEGFAPSFVKGGGCSIVEALARSLAGKVHYGPGPGAGAAVTVQFRIAGRPPAKRLLSPAESAPPDAEATPPSIEHGR